MLAQSTPPKWQQRQVNAKRLARQKGRKTSGTFALIPNDVLDSSAYAKLTFKARALLTELAGQYRGFDQQRSKGNNGNLSAAHALFKQRGWHRSTLQEATVELESAGLIFRTRQGGRNACNLYALTWRAIDECGGKLDTHIHIGGAPLRLWAVKKIDLTNPTSGLGSQSLARIEGKVDQ